MNVVAELIEQCVAENAPIAIDRIEYQKKYDGPAERFNRAPKSASPSRSSRQSGRISGGLRNPHCVNAVVQWGYFAPFRMAIF